MLRNIQMIGRSTRTVKPTRIIYNSLESIDVKLKNQYIDLQRRVQAMNYNNLTERTSK